MLVVLLAVLLVWSLGLRPWRTQICSQHLRGRLMLYYRLEKDLNSDDVVVFKKDGETYTGRIVAKGGDTVEITSDSELKVNGSIVVENEIYYSTLSMIRTSSIPFLWRKKNILFFATAARGEGQPLLWPGYPKRDQRKSHYDHPEIRNIKKNRPLESFRGGSVRMSRMWREIKGYEGL